MSCHFEDFGPIVPLVDMQIAADVRLRHTCFRIERGDDQLLLQLGDTPGVFFDTSRVDGTDGVPQLVQNVPPGRVMFGSHAPFLIPEAALIRVHESGVLDETSLRAVLSENAEHLFGNTTV